ncbi:hypothetical protein FB639_006061 [Coemansia asiatica]|nr:hypothetical protein FB639_006061 [Coemansia asiatica]
MNNLDISLGDDIDYIPAARSGLDDWESLIYVLCWLGTFGINTVDEAQRAKDLNAQIQEEKKAGVALKKQRLGQERQRRLKSYDDLSIREWREGRTSKIVLVKRTHMESTLKFEELIVDEFYKDEYKSLQGLVIELRKTLFDNDRYPPDCKGTFIFAKRVPHINPFQARVEYASNIMADLLAVVRDHRAKAIERMNNDEN